MLGFPHQKLKVKTMLLAISFLMGVVNFSNAQEASEHIHTADAVMNQLFTKDARTNSASFVIETLDSSFEFALEANSRLLGDSFTLNDNIALYKGKLSTVENSWARFTRVNGKMEGAFFDGEDLFIVKSYSEMSSMLDFNSLTRQESLYAQSVSDAILIVNVNDIENSGTCGLHNDEINSDQFNMETDQNSFDYELYVKELEEMLGDQADKEIQISLFADVEFVSSSDDATSEMLALLNIADGIYSEQIGVQFVLTTATELSDNGTLTSTNAVNLIIAFRNSGFENPGVSHLFTNKNLDGSTVGIAYVGSLCRNTSVGVTQKLGSKTAIIFAHELGHNFGAPHDNESGSACSATPSGYIMNPNVNGSGSTFSNCSVERILPVVAQAVGNCIADVSLVAPSITSVPSLEASIGNEYLYDTDGVVDADGTGPFDYSLDIAPAGMSIDSNGKIMWQPSNESVGVNTVQVRVANQAGSDIQIFDVEVEAQSSIKFINFNEVDLTSFGTQDATNSATIGDTPFELVLTGNTWKSILIDYEITNKTVIQFDFKSEVEAEIHGIAFDNNNQPNASNSFQIYGSQRYGNQLLRYNANGSNQSILIPVGEYIQGSFERLVFILDNDSNKQGVKSTFSNVIIFEDNGDGPPTIPNTPEIPVLNINDYEINSHMPNLQDFGNDYEIIEQGNGIRLEGNSWKKVIIGPIGINPSTLLKFDFKSDAISEIHGLGFYTGDVINSSRTIQLAGSQNYGIKDFTYTLEGEWQSFVIPIGEYFTMSQVELVFILDNDRNRLANSNFRNIQIIEE